jgi:hypothetical protein
MATAKKTSTAVAVKKPASGGLVSIQDQLKAMAAANAGRVAPPSGINIKVTQDKKFMLPNGQKVDGPLDLVIVDFTSRNEFYEGSYDPNNIASPLCFAINPEPKAMVPSANAPEPQCDTCTGCPQNQFGSAGKGKACKNMRVLAVLPPDADADTPMWLLKVSPTAIKGFDGLISTLGRMQAPPVQMVVEVDFNPSETFASLTFSNPRPNEAVAEHFARMDEARDLLAAEPEIRAAAPAAAKPQAKAVVRKAVVRR